MKTFLLIMVLLAGTFGSGRAANPPDIAQPSPDGKWLFKAHWLGDKGYMWELENTATHKSYFTQDAPATDDLLPQRLNALWSPDSRYLAINVYLGRIAFDVTMIATNDSVPTDQVKWPRAAEKSMIKEEDLKLWAGDGVTNTSAMQWLRDDTLVIGISMRAELVDKTSGAKFRIDSDRRTTIQFSGLKGKVVKDDPPEYEKFSQS